MMKFSHILTSFYCLAFFSLTVSAQLGTSRLFSDHMVLQRNEQIKVWGWDRPGQEITVQFNNQTKTAEVDSEGSWVVDFPSMASGGPLTMVISNGKEVLNFSDILIGDVWICSGQSNMEWTLQNVNNAEAEIAQAKDRSIRHFKVPRSYAKKPEKDLAGGTWEITSPETAGDFTAVGYFFAKNIRAHHDVPIGLINSSWGGSRIEPWMNATSLNISHPEAYLENIEAEQNTELNKMMGELQSKFPNLRKEGQSSTFNDTDWLADKLGKVNWEPIQVPGLWEDQGFNRFDGIAWYKSEFTLSKEEAENPVQLHLGKVDDSDFVYINKQKIGETLNAYNAKRIYAISPLHLKEGRNEVLVKVDDTGGGGGIYGSGEDLYLQTISGKQSLVGEWKINLCVYRESYMGINQIPMMLYNKMIYPLLNFPIQGAIWYQGESNAGNVEDATDYAHLFSTMIQQWRSDWNQANFPFLWVQLANFMPSQPTPVESNWAMLRDSQTKALSLPNTAQAVIIDLGEAEDIHPRNKQDVGYRLSLGARHLVFGEPITISGPQYKSHILKGNRLEISFDHIGKGLIIKDGKDIEGFAIAGSDKKFVWAKAKVVGDKVHVWNDGIKTPRYVQYGWADNPDIANLYNAEGLPTVPFRVGL
ncbi:sialate O-acetylesterase [Namhaeicola litoreus]|uniref:Sialate O-acetylesterase n=1 Tax=Namhaeicola litoreus TaxID=1052145 RepID=A0ABW3Y0U5_9FLAO